MPDRKPVEPVKLIDDQPILGDEDRPDRLGLAPFAKTLAGVALGTEGPFTVGIYGGWGVGKTSMLRYVESLINAAGKTDVVTVWFDAWQYEREEHPLFPLIAVIAESLQATGQAARFRGLVDGLKSVLAGMRLGFKPLGVGLDADLGKVLETYEKQRDSILKQEALYPEAFQALQDAASGGPGTVVVFIDDLDRCLPDKAVALLESIKLVLGQKGFIFLLGLDHRIVTSYLAKRYREQYGILDEIEAARAADTYLHKIVQLQFDVPHPEERFPRYVGDLLDTVHNDTFATVRPQLTGVLIAATEHNPRSLVRLVNNLIVDWTLWEELFRKEQEEHGWGSGDILTGMVITRVLQQHLGARPARRLALNDALLAALLEESPTEADGAPHMDRPGAAPDDRVVRDARSDETVIALLSGHGQHWREARDLRQLLFSFYRQREASWEAPESQHAILDRVLRRAIGLDDSTSPTSSQTMGVTELDFSGEEEFDDRGLSLIRGAPRLQTLVLSRTRVTNAGLAHLNGLTSLRRLALDGTDVSDVGLMNIPSLTGLKLLSLAGTRVSDAGLAQVKHMAGLQGLNLDDTGVTGTGLMHLAGSFSLRDLSLNGTEVADSRLRHLASLSGLDSLSLGDTRVTDEGLRHVGELLGLRHLGLRKTKVTNSGLRHIAGLRGLNSLDLDYTEVTDAGLRRLGWLGCLTTVCLHGTRVSEAGVRTLQEKLPACVVLWDDDWHEPPLPA